MEKVIQAINICRLSPVFNKMSGSERLKAVFYTVKTINKEDHE